MPWLEFLNLSGIVNCVTKSLNHSQCLCPCLCLFLCRFRCLLILLIHIQKGHMCPEQLCSALKALTSKSVTHWLDRVPIWLDLGLGNQTTQWLNHCIECTDKTRSPIELTWTSKNVIALLALVQFGHFCDNMTMRKNSVECWMLKINMMMRMKFSPCLSDTAILLWRSVTRPDTPLYTLLREAVKKTVFLGIISK